jgi:hypothetical protein
MPIAWIRSLDQLHKQLYSHTSNGETRARKVYKLILERIFFNRKSTIEAGFEVLVARYGA